MVEICGIRGKEEEVEDGHHYEEERLFEEAGWVTLDCANPFYHRVVASGTAQGALRTVCQTRHPLEHSTAGFEWYWKEGDCRRPAYAESHTVFQFQGTEWTRVACSDPDATVYPRITAVA